MSDFEDMVVADVAFIITLRDSERRRELERDLLERVVHAIANGDVKGLKAKKIAESCLPMSWLMRERPR